MMTISSSRESNPVGGVGEGGAHPPEYLGSRDDENSKNDDEIAKMMTKSRYFAISSSFFEFSSSREPRCTGGLPDSLARPECVLADQ